MRSVVEKLMKIEAFFVDLLFPETCQKCGLEGEYLCENCKKQIQILEYPLCPFCQKRTIDGKICVKCKHETGLTRFFAPLSYKDETARKMLWNFKYRRAKELAKTFSEILIGFLKKNNFSQVLMNYDAILAPVPLFRSRLKKRGFNQSEEIAKILSRHFQIPLAANILVKIKDTSPQADIKGENKEELLKRREENVVGVFSCKDPAAIVGKTLILVDDVYTSGATMKECAEVLKQAGAKEVWGMAVAKG